MSKKRDDAVGIAVAGGALAAAWLWLAKPWAKDDKPEPEPTPSPSPSPSPPAPPAPSPAPPPAPSPAAPQLDLSNENNRWVAAKLAGIPLTLLRVGPPEKVQAFAQRQYDAIFPLHDKDGGLPPGQRELSQSRRAQQLAALALILGKPIPFPIDLAPRPGYEKPIAQSLLMAWNIPFTNGLPGILPYNDGTASKPPSYAGAPVTEANVQTGEPAPPPLQSSPMGPQAPPSWWQDIKDKAEGWGHIPGTRIPVPTDQDVAQTGGLGLGKLALEAPSAAVRSIGGLIGVGVGFIDGLTGASKAHRKQHRTDLKEALDTILATRDNSKNAGDQRTIGDDIKSWGQDGRWWR